MIGGVGQSFVFAELVAKIAGPDAMPHDIGPLGVHRVTRLGGDTVKVEALLPERVFRLCHFSPALLDIADMSRLGIHFFRRNAVVIGTDHRIGRNNDVGQIGRGLGTLAMHNEVFAILDRLGDVTVAVQAARIGKEGLVLVNLFPKGDAGIGAIHHQGRAGLTILAGHDVLEPVARERDRGVQ